MIYFDNSSTTIPSEEVNDFVHKMNRTLFGNPSSLHHLGVESEKAINRTRGIIAEMIGSRKEEIYFTAGGTEADNMAIIGSAERNRNIGGHIITTSFEHAAVLNAAKFLEKKGFDVTYLVPDSSGFISPEAVEEAIREETILVSIMHVNNEIGSIQNIEKIGQLIKRSSQALFHVDAVQSYGKLPIDVNKSKIDLLSISGHKIHAFKGIGALYIRKGTKIDPVIYGGQQEQGIRPGTENLPGILSLFKATEAVKNSREANYKNVELIRDKMISGLLELDNIQINSDPEKGEYSPYVLNISFRNTRGEVLLHTLESKGIYVSTGSACHSKKKTVSHVLKAIGLGGEWIDGTVRLSFSKLNTMEEAEEAIVIIKESIRYLDKIMNRR
jgi:cysteine desulfurase